MLNQMVGLNKKAKIFNVEFSVLDMTKEIIHGNTYCNMYVKVKSKKYIGLINYKNPINDKYKLYDDIKMFYPILDWIVYYDIAYNNNNNIGKIKYDLINNYDYDYNIDLIAHQCMKIFKMFNKIFTKDEIKDINNMVAYF